MNLCGPANFDQVIKQVIEYTKAMKANENF